MIVARFDTALDGLRREEALLAEGRPALLLWQAEQAALVTPAPLRRRAARAGVDIGADAVGWPILARSSGGGVVPQGPHMLNLAIVSPRPEGFTTEDGYRLLCGAIAEALTRFDIDVTTGACPGSFCDGRWNVLFEGRKLAGTAQRWRGGPAAPAALLHAAILLHRRDDIPWRLIETLQSLSTHGGGAPIRPDAHVSLGAATPAAMKGGSFPGALLRAAEDRLRALAPDEPVA